MKRPLCLWFPNWPAQRVRRHPDRPIILHGRTPRGALGVMARSRSAARAGVKIGMPLAEAEALWPPGFVHFAKYDPAADRRALKTLAKACERYTPVIAIEDADAPECLLLDIAGSAHLFGDEQRLAETIAADFHRRDLAVAIGVADGIGAAWAVAHSQAVDDVVGRAPIVIVPIGKNTEIIPGLGVETLRLPDEVLALLKTFDLRTIQQVMLLPRGQVASRFGHEILVRIDQALGRLPELVTPEPYVEPARARWDFDDPVSHPQILEQVLDRLVRQLTDRLSPRGLGIQRLRGVFKTADRDRREFVVGLMHATDSPGRIMSLVNLRLEQVRLPAEVATIGLLATAAPLVVRQGTWFEPDDRGAALADFVERLSSRFGEDAVMRARLCEDDQPEYAWECVPWVSGPPLPSGRGVGGEGAGVPRPREWPLRGNGTLAPSPPASLPEGRGVHVAEHGILVPLDLLAGPLAMCVEVGPEDVPVRFAWRHRMYAVSRAWGPQRIDTGWWRERDVHRDYYRLETDAGERFWVFHERAEKMWFMHGVYA